MRKLLLLGLLFILLLLGSCFSQEMAQKIKQESNQEMQSKLTLVGAVDLAYSDAVKWDKDAIIIDAISIDDEEGIAGFEGTSGNWKITFGIPYTNQALSIKIQDGKIKEYADITDESAPPLSEDHFITDLSTIKFDSPAVVKKTIQSMELYPSENWRNEYTFGISKDIKKDIILIKIIGWDKETEAMKQLQYNANTGELIEVLELHSSKKLFKNTNHSCLMKNIDIFVKSV